LTCNFKDLNLSHREGVQCWLAWLCLAAWNSQRIPGLVERRNAFRSPNSA